MTHELYDFYDLFDFYDLYELHDFYDLHLDSEGIMKLWFYFPVHYDFVSISEAYEIGPSVDDQAVSLSDDGTTIIIEPYNQTEPAL